MRRSTGLPPGSARHATARCFNRRSTLPPVRRDGWSSSPTCSAQAGKGSPRPRCRRGGCWTSRTSSNDVKDVSKDGVPSNLAVTAATVGADRVVATIRNGGATAQHRPCPGPARRTGSRGCRLYRTARRDDRRVDRVACPGRRHAQRRVDDAEGLPADNARFVALGSRGAPKALIITADEPALYKASGRPAALVRVARARHHVGRCRRGRLRIARVSAMSDDEVSNYRGVALLSTRGLERAARDRLMTYVKSGGGLFVAAASDLEVAVLAEMTGWQPALTAVEQSGPLTLAATDLRHPIFRPFGALAANLGQVRFDRVVARVARGLVHRGALLERIACAARAAAWTGTRRALCLRRRPPMERLSTAPRVRTVRDRSPALRGRRSARAPGVHRSPGARRDAPGPGRVSSSGQSTVCSQRRRA